METYRGTVYPWHCDHMGHMNVMWYVGKFDEASWNFLASVGLTPAYLRESNRGIVAVEQRLSYKRELLAGDIVFVRSSIKEAREKVLLFRHEMINAQTLELAATSEYTAVHIDKGTRKACPLPRHVQLALAPQAANDHRPSMAANGAPLSVIPE
jgi:acyl-CoA thioester hydrolase